MIPQTHHCQQLLLVINGDSTTQKKTFFKGAESALPQHFRVSKSLALIGLNCLRVCMQFNNTFHRYQLKTLYIGWGFQLMFFMQKWTILFPKSFWNNVESFFILVTQIRFESSPSLLKITKRIGTRKIKKKRFEPITIFDFDEGADWSHSRLCTKWSKEIAS